MFRSQALETEQECTNPATDIAGVQWILPQLLALPSAVLPADDERREMMAALLALAPDLPLQPVPSTRNSTAGGCSVEGCACLASKEGCQPTFTRINKTIGLQSAMFPCTRSGKCYTCTSVETCEAESKAVCGADAGCKGFSLSMKWRGGPQAQYFTTGAANPHDPEPDWTHYRKDDASGPRGPSAEEPAGHFVPPCEFVNVVGSQNCENAGLYAVFPFRLLGLNSSTGINTVRAATPALR